MFVDWTVVYDNGERPYRPELSADQRRALRIVVGDDVTIRILLITPAGAPVALGAGESLVWSAKTSGDVSRKLVAKASTALPGAGRYQVALLAADTRTLEPQRCVHDLWAVRGSGRVNVIPISELVIVSSALGAVPP